MLDVDREPYMVWECVHKTEITETQWGVNLPPVCEECGGSDWDKSLMDFKTSVPVGCAYVWNESTIERAVGPPG